MVNNICSKMETESVRSGRSGRSDRSSRSRTERSGDPDRPSKKNHGHSGRRSSRDKERSGRSTDRDTDRETDREDRSVSARMPHTDLDGGRNNVHNELMGGSLPPDENWGETTTVITGTTSEAGYSVEEMSTSLRLNKKLENSIGFHCARYIGSLTTGLMAVIAFLSPVVMVILPKVNLDGWTVNECKPECEGLLISFGFKLIILLIGSWALFLRRPKSTMPRIFIFRAVVLLLVFVLTVAYWLFYGVRILATHDENYPGIVAFSVSMVDCLLFIHYLAVILLEIRQLQTQYIVKIVRSPDGQSRNYTVGQLTIQRLAVWCLEQYYKDFDVYNPYLDRYQKRPSRVSEFKVYNVDGSVSDTASSQSKAILAAAMNARHRETGHNDRFYQEEEFEYRVRKRRARLIVAAEESFANIKRLQEDKTSAIELTPKDAAQAIMNGVARPLQKYLRTTRQQPRYSQENVLAHLTMCVSHDMSAKAFVERYLTQGPVIWNDKDHKPTQPWTVLSTTVLNYGIADGTLFRLQQDDIVLLISVRKVPHFSLTEDVIDSKTKFELQFNTETSV